VIANTFSEKITSMMAEAHEAEDARPSFAEVLREHQGMVFSIALHYLRDRSVAEEVAQDVFLQLHRSFNELEPGIRMTFWLRKVTSNRCIDAIRKRKLRATVALDDAPEPRSAESQPDLLLNERLRALVGALPDKPRMVMVMRYQEELMPEEIARILGMPVRTVKSHLQRSLAMLREKIGRSMGEVR
jgi:RNA polymerase sigma-70 factor, ECF subfamily